MGIDPGRLLRTGAKGVGIGSALFGGTVAGIWWRLFRQPLPRIKGNVAVRGIEGPVEIVTFPGKGHGGPSRLSLPLEADWMRDRLLA